MPGAKPDYYYECYFLGVTSAFSEITDILCKKKLSQQSKVNLIQDRIDRFYDRMHTKYLTKEDKGKVDICKQKQK